MKELENKRIIVTGGCKGIGRAIVEKYLQEGAIVATTYYKSKDSSDQMKSELESYSDRLAIYNMDVSDPEQVNKVMEQIQDDLKGIDILVNNSGITQDSLLYSMKNSDWNKVIKTNLYGPFYTCKSVLLNMIKQKCGSIINIASVSGVVGIPGQSNYCASKFGLIGLTKSLAKELASKNIRVNAIAPGYVDTEMIDNVKIMKELMRNKHSQGRIGSPNEIANIALFLAGDASSYITGQVIVADGGFI
ncbi:3-oxoacyl-ACP reductase FabG [Paenibacillus polymyxa]|uniref:SDR family NAD(P)-dependent oxidoreductase n=1 Tax=Paenibacillus polymyxa TaxID=1406 RepID=UPI0004D7584C|nr:3-oxoacyl-ACP reductase FabG [Paenibacillus polymyxa]KEO78091.1 3-oxoacyl-ACP reductase [Paenibacillus polymyxa]MCH6188630.1 3-oxoacyl-ACP reductase FabG [Paenibacillus polymyxa]WRL58002.1 3-oxoacyl-ACP reductase FabG [Paenibacillus polymyxa]